MKQVDQKTEDNLSHQSKKQVLYIFSDFFDDSEVSGDFYANSGVSNA